jgi:hypothetical protein
MKAIVIDPYNRVIAQEARPSTIRSFKTEFAEPRRIGTLPNGDTLWAETNRIDRATFALGSGQQVVGIGLLVGKKDDVGSYTNPRSDIETIRSLVRFSELAGFEVETTPKVITPLIKEFLRELKSQPPEYVQVVTSMGGRIGRCWENVGAVVRKNGGQRRYGWTIWERSGLFLTAEFHAVWCTADGELVDVTPKADGERRVLFSTAPQYSQTFNFLHRPANRRHRVYRIEPDISEAIGRLSASQRSYETRRAAKRGYTLEQHLAAKATPDELEAAIDKLFAICTQTDSLVEVTFEGLTSKHPGRVRQLDSERMCIHDRILQLAREKLSAGAASIFQDLERGVKMALAGECDDAFAMRQSVPRTTK